MSVSLLPPVFERVRILMVRPENVVDAAAFDEIALSLAVAFKQLGARTDIVANIPLVGEGVNIVFGAQLIPEGNGLPPNSVIVNLEQFGSGWFAQQPHYRSLLKSHAVIDYSQRNVERVRAVVGHDHVHALPIGYVAELSRIDVAPVQDIDVLFYGALNERRRSILDALSRKGLRVQILTGVYGKERDAVIARAKIVLNVHFYADAIHEVVRSSYLLANRKVVVSECNDDTEIDVDLREAIVATPYDQLVSTCVRLVHDEAQRREIAARGLEIFKRREQAVLLAQTLTKLCQPVPKRINLGSGRAFDATMLNIDIDPRWQPDLVGDIAAPNGLHQVFFSRRFGLVRLQRGSFDEINTHNVLEHVSALVPLMTRCIELLRAGGAMQIGVAYDLSYGAWQDPTQVRAFNERSWRSYTDAHWNIGWTEARFDLAELHMVPSPLGETLRQRGVGNDEVVRTPRAIDGMQVRLVKRELTESERQQALDWHGGNMSAANTRPDDVTTT